MKASAAAALLLLTACSAAPPLPELPPDHPASPNAEVAPFVPPPDTLRLPEPAPRSTDTAPKPPMRMPHGGPR